LHVGAIVVSSDGKAQARLTHWPLWEFADFIPAMLRCREINNCFRDRSTTVANIAPTPPSSETSALIAGLFPA
jgi:hypothetical protein